MSNTLPLVDVIIPVTKIPSENTYLAPGVKRVGGKLVSYLYTTDKVRKYKSEIVDYLTINLTSKLQDNYKYYSTEFEFFLKRHYDTRDLSNLKKTTEDALIIWLNRITEGFKIDDRQFVSSSDRKTLIGMKESKVPYPDYEDYEFIRFKLYPASEKVEIPKKEPKKSTKKSKLKVEAQEEI